MQNEDMLVLTDLNLFVKVPHHWSLEFFVNY